MACPEFVDLLVDYRELDDKQRQAVDSHLSSCAGCLVFHGALIEVDSTLTAAFTGLEASATLPQGVMTQTPIRPPSFVPMLLDLTGSVAVLTVAMSVLDVFVSGLPLNIPTYWAATALFVVSAIVVGYRSYADLKN